MTAASGIPPLHIGLVGCGHMGSAMVEGWLHDNAISRISILDPAPMHREDTRIHHAAKMDEFAPHLASMDILILAVKPQIMENLCDDLAAHIPETLPILSIAAGYSITSFYKSFPQTQTIIRAMPNTPGAIGQGITGALRSPNLPDTTASIVNTVLAPLGSLIWVNEEDDINKITALSGSGPAYVFYMMEALAKAGVKIGLSEEDAKTLARQTVIGGAALADNNPDTTAKTLRQNVTSPGGTTEAALEILMDGSFDKILENTLTAALIRARDLS